MRNEKYRIAIDARFILRPMRGIPHYVYEICCEIPNICCDYECVYFINSAFEHNDSKDAWGGRVEHIRGINDNITLIDIKSTGEIFWEQVLLPIAIKKYKIDLLHMPANRSMLFCNVPTVVTVHDVMEYIYLEKIYTINSLFDQRKIRLSFYNIRQYVYKYVMYRYLMNISSRVITVSKYSRNDIFRYLKIDRNRVDVIYHGIDHKLYFPEYTSRNSRKKIILALGGASIHKNIAGYIKLWNYVNKDITDNYILKIVGYNGNDTDTLLSLVQDPGKRKNLQIKGWLPDHEIISSFKESSLFLCLSLYEGFGFPLIQAMACGTPVIASNNSSIPEVLNGAGTLVNPIDYHGISRAINEHLSDENIWQKKSEAGIKSSKRFSWSESAKAHFEIYKNVLESSL